MCVPIIKLQKQYSMKKTLLFGAAIAIAGISANAQSLGDATIVEGKYLVTMENLMFTWDQQAIEFNVETTDLFGYDVGNTTITLKKNDGSFETEGYVVLTHVNSQLLGDENSSDDTTENGIMVLDWGEQNIGSDGMSWVTGEYTITIPADLVKLQDDDATNPGCDIEINVMVESYRQGSVSPAPGETYLPAELGEVKVVWKENDSENAEAYSLSVGEGYITYYNHSDAETSVDGGSAVAVYYLGEENIKFNEKELLLDLSGITEPGEYVFTIPSSYVILNGDMLGVETTFTYIISTLPTLSNATQITPAKTDDTMLVFSFDTPVSLSNEGFSALFFVNSYLGQEGDIIPADAIALYDNENLEGALTSGQYVSIDLAQFMSSIETESVIYVTVPAGMFVAENGAINVEQTFQFMYEGNTDAINVINTESVKNQVYNLQGVRVDANNLPAGIYIINGKKVAVK